LAGGKREVSLPQSDPIYEIYAIRYAHHDRPASENFIGLDSHESQPLDYFVWAVVGGGKTFVVDTGFDEAAGKKRHRTLFKPVREGLSAIGVNLAAVSDVIITHLHYDHCGNHELFPQATYHLQDCEMNYATGRCMCHQHLRLPFEADDVTAMVRKVFSGRVTFHDGESEIAPGITVHKIGGHSKGLQCVRVSTRRGPIVLASDSTHLYQHLEEGRVFPIVYNVGEVLEGYRTLLRLGGNIDHIIPGHDPMVLEKYPAPRPELKNWVARLD
jgi:glyoxylase-like metal-dependent hydrolase (beta-lactamase superfamily II)